MTSSDTVYLSGKKWRYGIIIKHRDFIKARGKTSPAERDYSFIASAQHQDMSGVCIYCNHCQPCPYGIDIAAVNKYLDLAQAGDGLSKDHYFKLRRTARDCTYCGACVSRCPFHVDILKRMREANEFFGR